MEKNVGSPLDAVTFETTCWPEEHYRNPPQLIPVRLVIPLRRGNP